MNKLDQLRQMVAELFAAAEDKTTIQKSAIINEKFNEVEAESTKIKEDYDNLLKDYKDVVLHTSFKPQENVPGNNGAPEMKTFNGDEFIASFIEAQKQNK